MARRHISVVYAEQPKPIHSCFEHFAKQGVEGGGFPDGDRQLVVRQRSMVYIWQPSHPRTRKYFRRWKW